MMWSIEKWSNYDFVYRKMV